MFTPHATAYITAQRAARYITDQVGLPRDAVTFVRAPGEGRYHFTVRASYEQVAQALPEAAGFLEPCAAMWEMVNRIQATASETTAVVAECSVLNSNPGHRRLGIRFTVSE